MPAVSTTLILLNHLIGIPQNPIVGQPKLIAIDESKKPPKLTMQLRQCCWVKRNNENRIEFELYYLLWNGLMIGNFKINGSGSFGNLYCSVIICWCTSNPSFWEPSDLSLSLRKSLWIRQTCSPGHTWKRGWVLGQTHDDWTVTHEFVAKKIIPALIFKHLIYPFTVASRVVQICPFDSPKI